MVFFLSEPPRKGFWIFTSGFRRQHRQELAFEKEKHKRNMWRFLTFRVSHLKHTFLSTATKIAVVPQKKTFPYKSRVNLDLFAKNIVWQYATFSSCNLALWRTSLPKAAEQVPTRCADKHQWEVWDNLQALNKKDCKSCKWQETVQKQLVKTWHWKMYKCSAEVFSFFVRVFRVAVDKKYLLL